MSEPENFFLWRSNIFLKKLGGKNFKTNHLAASRIGRKKIILKNYFSKILAYSIHAFIPQQKCKEFISFSEIRMKFYDIGVIYVSVGFISILKENENILF